MADIVASSSVTPSVRASLRASAPSSISRRGRMAKRPTSIKPRMMSMWRRTLRGVRSRRETSSSARVKQDSASAIATTRVEARPAAYR